MDDGWTLALTAPGAATSPAELPALIAWHDAPVPGLAAEVLGPETLCHAHDVWYRRSLPGAGMLHFEGLATIAEIWTGDTLMLCTATMFAAHSILVTAAGTLYLCFRALNVGLAAATGPRARWRTTPSAPASYGGAYWGGMATG